MLNALFSCGHVVLSLNGLLFTLTFNFQWSLTIPFMQICCKNGVYLNYFLNLLMTRIVFHKVNNLMFSLKSSWLFIVKRIETLCP